MQMETRGTTTNSLKLASLKVLLTPPSFRAIISRMTFDPHDRAGQRSYVKLLRGRREEPGNEASSVASLVQGG